MLLLNMQNIDRHKHKNENKLKIFLIDNKEWNDNFGSC